MQGQVLAYNNMTYQVSMIVAPLVAGAIYMWNREWVLYSSAIIAVIGALTMGYMCTWKDVKTIGKKMNVNTIACNSGFHHDFVLKILPWLPFLSVSSI